MKLAKQMFSVLLCGVLTLGSLAACGQPASSGTTTAGVVATTGDGTKPTIKFYGKVIEYTSGPMMTDALSEALKDKYIIDAIQVDWGNMDTVIRTGIASNEPCDIYNYPPQNMMNFADMAVDLKPYLDADPEWKAQFSETALAAGTIDGKILGIPWESNFSVIIANKTELDKLGITIPEQWTMEEFMATCKTIMDKGVFPFANATDQARADWLYRNAMLSVVVSDNKYEEYKAGTLPLNGSEAQKALDSVKALYDAGYMYPGDGAVTAKNDEIKAAFYQGEVLMMPEIASGAKTTAADADFETVIIPWPSTGSEEAILGGYNGFFIPKNSANIDAAVEVLKAYTSVDIQKIHGEQGYIPANVNVQITDPFVKSVVAQAASLYSPEDPATPAMQDYKANNLMPDLLLNGGVQVVMDKLDEIRQEG